MDKNDRKATIIDISQKTGYSIATVSRALNNFPNVKEATKKKILEISKSLNYIPNVAAKHLVKGKSKIERVYDHYDYDKEKADALAKWASHLEQIVTPPGNVVLLRA